MKYCNNCCTYKEASEFHKDSRKKDGLTAQCAECNRRRSKIHYGKDLTKSREKCRRWKRDNPAIINMLNSNRRSAQFRATPRWYETELVANVYKKASEFGFHVDHIVPLNSSLVCGLHCWANLQLLSPELNLSKGNRDWPDSPFSGF